MFFFQISKSPEGSNLIFFFEGSVLSSNLNSGKIFNAEFSRQIMLEIVECQNYKFSVTGLRVREIIFFVDRCIQNTFEQTFADLLAH